MTLGNRDVVRPAGTTRVGHRGFTIIELMIVVLLVAVLAALAAPNMSTFVTSRRVEDAARRLAEDMAAARNEAIKRNATILLCADASVTTSACQASPASGDWAKGWRLCYDLNGDGSCDVGKADDPNPIRVQPAINTTVNLVGPASRIRFNSNGTLTVTDFTNFDARGAGSSTARWLVRFAASGAISARKV